MDTGTINPERKAHKGLLREELLLLRHTFGLNLGRSQEMFDQTYAKIGGENLPGSIIKDLLIVSIDIESRPNQAGKENLHCRVGVSILDTRHLQSQTTETNYQSILETFNFFIGKEKYLRKHVWRFCFGQSTIVNSIEDIRHEIHKLVSGRDVILVVHGGRDDLAFLEAAQIDLQPLYIVDTQKAAQHPLNLDRRCNLGELLNLLKCPFDPEMLHSAGNDANLSLRALLLIATLDARNHLNGKPGEPDCGSLLTALERIATGLVPLEEFREILEKEREEKFRRANPKSHGRKARRKAQEKAIRRKQAQLKTAAKINAPDPVEVAKTCKKNWVKLLLS